MSEDEFMEEDADVSKADMMNSGPMEKELIIFVYMCTTYYSELSQRQNQGHQSIQSIKIEKSFEEINIIKTKKNSTARRILKMLHSMGSGMAIRIR